MNLHPLLATLFVLPLMLPAPAGADEPVPDEEGTDEAGADEGGTEDEEQPKDELLDDLCSPFLFVGGGAGAILPHKPIQPEFTARLAVGGGFYVPMLYLSGGLDFSFRETITFMFDGWGAAGISVPTPVFHPLIGFKIGGGLHTFQGTWGPQLVYGPQIGWLVRGYNKKVGFRAVVEPAVRYFPLSGTSTPEIVLTLSLVL
jgi:hypothetical protein